MKKKSSAPLELVAPDSGLSEGELNFAKELIAKYPRVSVAYKEVKAGEEKLKGKWLGLCEALRDPKDGIRLNGREMTLLLKGLGERKQRITEIVKVVSVDDALWEKYKQGILGFRAVLQIARNPELPPEPAADAEPDADADADTEKPAARQTEQHPVPGPVAEAMAELLGNHYLALPPVGKGYYQMTYSVATTTGVRRQVMVTFEVDDSPAKAE